MKLFSKVVFATVSFIALQGCVVVAPVTYVPYEELELNCEEVEPVRSSEGEMPSGMEITLSFCFWSYWRRTLLK